MGAGLGIGLGLRLGLGLGLRLGLRSGSGLVLLVVTGIGWFWCLVVVLDGMMLELWFCGLWCVLLVIGWFGKFGANKVFFEVFVSLICHNRLIWPYL